MEHRYIVHPAKLAASLPTGILLLWGGVIQLSTRLWWCGLLFIAFGVLFLMVAALYGRVVHVGPSGVRWTLLGRKLRSRAWEQIGEIGVVDVAALGNAICRFFPEYTAFHNEEAAKYRRSVFLKETPDAGTEFIKF